MTSMEDAAPRETVPAESAPAAMLAPTAALSGESLAVALRNPQEAPEDMERSLERFGLRVGDLHLLADHTVGREALEPPPVYPLPHTPSWLAGLANVRGSIIPVMDLAVAFGTRHVTALKPYLLVMRHGDESVAVQVDGLPKVLTLRASERLANPPTLSAGLKDFVSAVYDHGGLVWLELDFARLFETMGRQIVRAA